MRRVLKALAGALALAVALSVTAVAQGDGIDAVLARPVSPGTLALLLQYPKDPRALTRWSESLANRDPHIRATAARLLRVSTVSLSIPALLRALAAESDVATAREIGGALVSLGGSTEDRAVLDAAKRLSLSDLAIVVATTRHERAIAELPQFDQLKLTPGERETVVSGLASGPTASIDRLALAVLDLPSRNDWWEPVLAVAVQKHVAIGPVALEKALASESQAMRDDTWWFVAISGAEERPSWKQLPPEPASAATPSTEAAFARELAARAYKAHPRPQPAFESLVQSGTKLSVPEFANNAFGGSLYRLLTKSERNALKVEEPAEFHSRHLPAKVDEKGTDGIKAIRTIGSLPDGYVADVLEQTGCRSVDSGDIAGAVARFEDGVLKEVQWVANKLVPECDRAARYITSLDLLPERAMTSGERELIAVPMHQAFLECRSRVDPPRQEASPARIGVQDIKPPTKIRHVAPEYPWAAQQARRQGIVIIESTISPAGCVREATVLRSVGVDLDLAALRAVTGWQFTPTLLNGVPVPVIMTVTVQFTLQ